MVYQVEYIGKDKQATSFMAKGKHIDICSIVMVEWFAIWEAPVMAKQKYLHRMESDSQYVVKAINGKTSASREIINMAEDIRRFVNFNSIKYCRREYSRDADRIAKTAQMYSD